MPGIDLYFVAIVVVVVVVIVIIITMPSVTDDQTLRCTNRWTVDVALIVLSQGFTD